MKKSDLKNRMLVEDRVGTRYMVVDDYLIREGGYERLVDFCDDLTFSIYGGTRSSADRRYDIVKVYKPSACFVVDESKLLWERTEVKELTLSEIEDKLGYKIKIVEEKN